MYKDIDEAIKKHRQSERNARTKIGVLNDETFIRLQTQLAEQYSQEVAWLEELKAYKEKELKHIHDILPPVPNCKLFDVEKLTEQLKESKE